MIIISVKNYPYRDGIDENWDGVLTEFIPKFIECFVVIMLILGVIQFIPSVYKGRKPFRLIIMWIMGFLWTVFSIMLIIGDLPNYYKDIHEIISSDYSSYEGKLINHHIVRGKSTTTYFTIGDKEFHVNGKYDSNVLIEGRKYRIEYLPNTKYVINLYRYGN